MMNDDKVTKEELLQLKRELEVYRTTAQFSNSVVFRLHIQSMEATFYGDLTRGFNLVCGGENFEEFVRREKLVHRDDMETFQEMMVCMQAGVERKFHLRLCALTGRQDWYLLDYKIITDGQGNAVEAIGKISNIQATKDLQDKANLDPLTGCLNKTSFEAVTSDFLSNSAKANSAYMIIDIDNFKKVNDSLGHLFGDIVLKEIVGKMRRVFREDDFIGRAGGDEFVVLMRNVDDRSVVERKAREVVEAMDITYKGKGDFYRVTASVGVAMTPHHGRFYEELYNNADLAMYHAKNLGKNGFAIFNETMAKGTMENKTPIDVANRAVSAHFNQDLVIDVFNLLFQEDDNHLDAVLSHLGQHFNVDRCYIFEKKGDKDAYDNTYEWCAEGIEPQMHLLQDLPLETFQETFDQSDTDGVYYCNDIDTVESESTREALAMQGILSVVLTFVKRGGEVRYVLGFDDCTTTRRWKPVEISTLAYSAKMVAQYLRYCEALEGTT